MLKTFSRLAALTMILCFVILSFLGCSPQASPTPETTISPEQPTATEKFIPVVSKNTEEVVIFSYEEDGYAHLFAYIPGKMPLTRITAGDWTTSHLRPAQMVRRSPSHPTAVDPGICISWIWQAAMQLNSPIHLIMKAHRPGRRMAHSSRLNPMKTKT